MAMTGDYSADEASLRDALKAKLEAILSFAPFDFPADHISTRRRYIRDVDVWKSLTMIVDPDDLTPAPVGDAPDLRAYTMRLVSIETASSDINRALREWRLVWAVKIGVGFKDERPNNLGNSYDYLMQAAYTTFQQVLEDPSLGFDDALTIYRTRQVAPVRFVPQDKQGNSAQVIDCEIYGVVPIN